MLTCHTLFFPAHDTNAIDEFQDQFFPFRPALSPHIKILTHRKCVSKQVMDTCLEDTLANFKPFEIHLADLDQSDREGWLFLRVREGNDQIVALQKALIKCTQKYTQSCKRVEPRIVLGFFARDRQGRQWAYEEAASRDFSFRTLFDRVTTVVYDPKTNKILETQDFKLGLGP